MYLIGCGKADITAYVKGVGMLGFGMYFHTMEGVETPLYSRAFVLADSEKKTKVAIVNAELGFITIALKKGVLTDLLKRKPDIGYTEENFMLTAQHTHSGPGGYSYYGLYNISIPGFVKEVYEKLVSGITDSILEAEQNLQPGNISFGKSAFGLDKNVAFNRSMNQYNQNPEANPKLTRETLNTGVDRNMYLLRFTDASGNDMGSINWFGVHTTSVSNDLNKVCSDNKGYAADALEQKMPNRYIGAFAQGSCGDITPRFKYNPKRKYQRGNWDGISENDYESAKYNGQLQAEKALEIIDVLKSNSKELNSGIDCDIQYVDFTQVNCNPKYTNGKLDARTGPAAMGMAFFGGAYVDGPGAHPIVVKLAKIPIKLIKLIELIRAKFFNDKYKDAILIKYKTQSVKDIVIEPNARRMLGTKHIDQIVLPEWVEPSIALLKNYFIKEGYKRKPWTAKILPLQIFTLGEVAICAFPFEITTIAAKRLKESLLESLSNRSVKEIILAPYANSYSGYITTFEEYQVQMYEGGHTVFGEWSLAALQTKFDELAQAMNIAKEKREIVHDSLPPDFTEEELNQYPFFKAKWYERKEKQLEKKALSKA
jgi:neutral ceramidase